MEKEDPELGVFSFLITSKNWKVKDIEDLYNAHPKIKALFYASLLAEAEETEKINQELKSKMRR